MARIGIDLDGVCYDFTAAFCRYVGWDPTTVNKWEFFKDHGYTSDEFLGTCRIMIKNDLLFSRGYLIPGAKEALLALAEAGHSIHYVTDRISLDPDNVGLIVKATHEWITDNDLPIDSIHFTGEKAEVAKSLGLDFFLDDKMENCEALWDAGIEAYLFDQPWNQCESGCDCARVYGWDEFVKVVDMAVDPGESQGLADLDEGLTQWEIGSAKVLTKEEVLEEVRVTSKTGGMKGQKLARIGSLDPKALMEVAKVAGFGERKYARLNYLKGYDWSLSYDACQRHLHAHWSGEELDPESGLPHLAHAAWHCLAQLAFMIHGIGTDDRFKPEEDAA